MLQLEQMTEESHSSLAVLKSQLEEFKEKSRKEITDSQKQAKDRGAEVEKMQFSMGRLQDEVWQGLAGSGSLRRPLRPSLGCPGPHLTWGRLFPRRRRSPG